MSESATAGERATAQLSARDAKAAAHHRIQRSRYTQAHGGA
jgi:hypothetical protein